jgi:prepilin-type N-terminal cleavage/methylation domain-containing protein
MMRKFILKIGNWKLEIGKLNRGMTYVELIVVLSIFAVMSSIALFNYGTFQGKVDIKNLVNDIALKVVEAQKAATFGQLNSHTYITNWKPAYGVYFTLNSNGLADNKSFDYFSDLNNNTSYDDSVCSPSTLGGECLDKINITKGNYVSLLTMYYQDSSHQSINDVSIFFTRPNSGASFRSTSSLSTGISYLEIQVSSPRNYSANVRVYASGRLEIH